MNTPSNNHSRPRETSDFGGRSTDDRFSGVGPKNYKRPDERIREDACEALTRHRDIDASEIEVEVKEGVVILKGSVDSRPTKRLAEQVCETVAGVKDVVNSLRTLSSGQD